MQMRPKNYNRLDRGHVWMSEGLAPIFGYKKNPGPHIGLPVTGYFNPEHEAYIVMDQGTFVSTYEGQLVPANGGQAVTVTYTSQDADAGVKASYGVGVAAGDTKVFPANKPIGIVFHDMYQSSYTLPNGFNTYLAQNLPTIVTEGFFQLPVVRMTDAQIDVDATFTAYAADAKKIVAAFYDFQVGDLVAPDSIPSAAVGLLKKRLVPTARTGGVRRFVETAVTLGAAAKAAGFTDIAVDGLSQAMGRVGAVLTDVEYPKEILNSSKTDGIEVQGDGTYGFERSLWNAFKDTLTNSAKRDLYTRKIILVNTNK